MAPEIRLVAMAGYALAPRRSGSADCQSAVSPGWQPAGRPWSGQLNGVGQRAVRHPLYSGSIDTARKYVGRTSHALQIANLRYSRLPVGATSLRLLQRAKSGPDVFWVPVSWTATIWVQPFSMPRPAQGAGSGGLGLFSFARWAGEISGSKFEPSERPSALALFRGFRVFRGSKSGLGRWTLGGRREGGNQCNGLDQFNPRRFPQGPGHPGHSG
jgi:hypothetical protein